MFANPRRRRRLDVVLFEFELQLAFVFFLVLHFFLFQVSAEQRFHVEVVHVVFSDLWQLCRLHRPLGHLLGVFDGILHRRAIAIARDSASCGSWIDLARFDVCRGENLIETFGKRLLHRNRYLWLLRDCILVNHLQLQLLTVLLKLNVQISPWFGFNLGPFYRNPPHRHCRSRLYRLVILI